MKKTLLLGLLFAGFWQVQAQEKNIVKASLLFGNAGIQYERALGKHFSIAGQAGFGFLNVSDYYGNNEFTTGTAYNFEGRYYFSSSKGNMQGWHIGPAVSYLDTKGKDVPGKFKTTVFGAMTGSQWIFDSHLTLEFVLGVGYKQVKYENTLLDDQDTLPAFVTGGVSLGYAF